MTKKNKPVSIVLLPSNLGLIEPSPGREPGVKYLPEWFRKYGFFDMIEPVEEIVLTPPPYSMLLDPESDMRNTDSIALYAKQQVPVIQNVISKNHFALVLGGDCSILIGNVLALKQLGHYKLFFIDGHTDFMWPSLSSTHGVAGMDLAIVTGNGHPKLSDIDQLGPYVNEEDVWCVGNREYDEDYVRVIENSSIHYYDLKTLIKSGMASCIDSFFSGLDPAQHAGFWVHLDVDVLDSRIMPAVDSPDPGGLSYSELNGLLENLLIHPLCVGLEITILDPDRDPEGRYVKEFISATGKVIANALNQKIHDQ